MSAAIPSIGRSGNPDPGG